MVTSCGGQDGNGDGDGGAPPADATAADSTVTPPLDSGVLDDSDFTVIALPDTQGYVAWKPDVFTDQVTWIASQRDALNIQYVAHVGDVVMDAAEPTQWDFVVGCMDVLTQAEIPFALCPGNHDYLSGTRDSVAYNEAFPISVFEAMPGFGAAFEPQRSDNSYHLFSAGSVDFMILALEFGPRDAVLTWANEVVAAHAQRTVIIVTHAYLYDDGTLMGPTHEHSPTNGYGLDDANDGVDMWDKLVRHHGNIAFVISGHVDNQDGAAVLTSTGDQGNEVVQMITNYQNQGVQENGYLRVLLFRPQLRRVEVTTYSPWTDTHHTDPDNQFTITDVSFFP